MGGIGLLGPVQVDGAAPLEPRDRIALSVLTVRRGATVSPDQLADALWGENLPRSWSKQVQICIGRVRKAIGAPAIETVPGGYRLAVAQLEVDVDQFDELVERGRALVAVGEPDRAATAFARALALWRGEPLVELDGWLPGRSEAARLVELHLTTQDDWLEARLAAGEHRRVCPDAEALVEAEPLRERRWAALALARYRCGRQADALRSLAQARHALIEASGVDPGPELLDLEAAILRQDEGLAVPEPAVPAASDECPYKGLAYYDAFDADAFYGRQAEIDECRQRLRTTPLLVVAGPSGCGKSSLVRAGLVPALRRDGHDPVVMVPGADPLAALLHATSTGTGQLLVVDQLEELFTLGAPVPVIQDLCARLADHAVRVAPVILVVRADHLGGLGIDPALSRLAEQGLHLVGPLTGDALREAIERPATGAGLRLEAGLVDLLVRECDGEPGALPLLSHALVETWRRRDGSVLTVEGYRASGGIRVAVARSADRLYDSLPPEQRATLRSVLLRLVTPSIDGEPVRCRVASRSLLDDPGRERVVALLVRSRLVTSEADAFELAHEALARAWPRLQAWLDEDASGQRVLRHLTSVAEGWESLGRPVSELYRGARLEAALEWRDSARPDLTAVERDFLEVSEAQSASESRALVERARVDAAQNRRLRTLLVTTAVLLVGALLAVGFALATQREVGTQRDVAQEQRRIAVARELAAASEANLTIDPELSVLLSLAAVEATEPDGVVIREAEEALHHAVTADRVVRRVPGVGGALDWNPDGATFVSEGPEGSGIVDIRNVETGGSERSFSGHDGDVTDVAFGPDGTRLATTGTDGAARVWDPATGRLVQEVDGSSGPATGPSFSADGTLFAAAWPEVGSGVVQVVDLASGEPVRTIDSVPGAIATSFEPAGGRLVVASARDPLAGVIDLSSGARTQTLTGHSAPLGDAVWSPDGTRIATASNDGSARVFDAATGTPLYSLLAHGSGVVTVDWSADASSLATGSGDGTAKVWSLIEGAGREVASLSVHDTRSGVSGVAFSPHGDQLLTGDASITSAIVWDVGVTAGREVANLPAVSFFVGAAEFDGDRRLVSTGGGGSLGVWDVGAWTGQHVGHRAGPEPSSVAIALPSGADVERLAIDPVGELAAVIRPNGFRVEVLDLASGLETFAIDTGSEVGWADWSPDGELLAVSDGERRRLTVYRRTGEEVNHTEFSGVWVGDVHFTSDGHHVAVSLEPDRVALWNWRTGSVDADVETSVHRSATSPIGRLLATKPHFESEATAIEIWDARADRLMSTLAEQTGDTADMAFSPDGSRFATASADGTIRLWDPRTGEQLLLLAEGPVSVTSVSFNPDGTQLATYGVDGVVRVWTLDFEELIRIARDRVTRHLTADECQQYLHRDRCPAG